MAQSVSVNSRGLPSKNWIEKAPEDTITVKFDFGLFFDGNAASHTSAVVGTLGIESSALLDNIVTVVISGGENGGNPSLVVSATDGTETKQVSLEVVVNNFLSESTSSGTGGGGVPVAGGDTITAFVLVSGTLTITTDQGAWPVDLSGLDQSAHVADTANPHSVTKEQVGLGNADNTSDVDKPISSLQQTALDNKEGLLGSPVADGQVLASTAAGVRGWTPLPIESDTVIYVKQASDLSGTLDSTKLYVIDGIIDMGTQSIEVPVGGLNIHGYTFDISGLTSSEDGYTLFTSPVGGSGNLLGIDFYAAVTGVGSKVFDLQDSDGTHAIEFQRVNYNGCTSLGEVDSYRQWLEDGTGRFGGQPSLAFTGAWAGGCLVTTSIVRGIDNAMTDALFNAGTSFVMQSRFRTNLNADLGTLAPLMDFSDANFPNPSTLQIANALITRNGVADASDTTLYPNIDAANLSAAWHDNIGMPNTHVGGDLAISTEVLTSISSASTFVTLAGTWTATDLQHFDSPSNGQLRHLGENPRDYKVIGDLVIEGGPNDELEVRIRKFDSSASTTSTIGSQVRQVNNLQGGRDVAIFSFTKQFMLGQNDYIFLEIANNTDTADVTAELDSFILVEAR